MKRLQILLLAGLALSAPLHAQEFLKGKILYFESGKPIAERGGTSFDFSLLGGLSSDSSVSLLSVERAIEKAADDDGIAMIFLQADKLSARLSSLEELRESLARFSAKGKPVVCYGASFGNGSYYLASVADRVFMHPDSWGVLTGLASTQMYYKDLLDSLGVDVQLIRHGSFKSAGEPFIRSEMSPENREQYQVLLNSMWDPMVESMASSRGIDADTLRTWIDGLELSTSRDWLERGLVDGLKYRDEMQEYLCHLFGKNYPDELRKVSMSSYIGELKNKGSKKVAVVYAEGNISRSGSGPGEKLARQIAQVRADSTVKAVVLRVNSPGGEVVAADMIRREIELLRKDKPVIASYGTYAASGGYLISAGTDRIFLGNTTLTGSIGVFGQVVSTGRALRKKLHINTFSVGTNAHSDMVSGFRPLSEDEVRLYQSNVDGIYDTFVKVVSEGRGMDHEEVEAVAQGRVWAGRDALENGLADEKGTLLDAIHYAADKAGLKTYRLVLYPEKKSLLDGILSYGGKQDDPLIRLMTLFPQGYSTVAKLPSIEINL